jgi:hypothetical protein
MGRRPTSWVDVLRHRLWYQRIREVFPLPTYTDHWLDRRFAGNHARSSADAPKTFSRLRAGGFPNLTPAGPAGVDVVANVAEAVRGSAELLTSPFWDHIKRPPGIKIVRNLLDAFLDAHSLEQISSRRFDEKFSFDSKQSDKARRLEAMRMTLRHLDTQLDRLTFLLLVERVCDFADVLDARELARSLFDEQLEAFLGNNWIGLHEGHYHDILNAALREGKNVNPGEQWALTYNDASGLIVPSGLPADVPEDQFARG